VIPLGPDFIEAATHGGQTVGPTGALLCGGPCRVQGLLGACMAWHR